MHEDFEARRMRRRRFVRRNLAWIVPLGVAAAVGFFFGIGTLVEWLWRVTLVDIFAIKPISFWQAWGLILLSQFLFKANMQPTTRTGRWRYRDRGFGDAPETAPRPAPGDRVDP
jgi:hypothetical protein